MTGISSNLVAGDFNFARDVFLRDLISGNTERISYASASNQLFNPGEWGKDSYDTDISDDGRFVVFTSEDSNLITADSWSGPPQIFLLDRQTRRFTRISSGLTLSLGMTTPSRPRISPSGDYVLFKAIGPIGQWHLVRYERSTGALQVVNSLIDPDPLPGPAMSHAISDDGRNIAFDSPLPPLGIIAIVHEVYRSVLSPGRLQFTVSTHQTDESVEAIRLSVERIDGGDGEVSVVVALERESDDNAAQTPYDIAAPTYRNGFLLSWSDRDTSVRDVVVPIVNDWRQEESETFRLRLVDSSGGAVIGVLDSVVVTIVDDD